MQLLQYYKRGAGSLLLEDSVQISAKSRGIWCGESFIEDVTIEAGLEP